MMTISFNYWTDLMRCGCGGNVGGKTTVALDDQEEKAFLDAIEPAHETRDMLGYFRDNLSPSLSEKICNAITEDFRRVMAQDAIDSVGKEVFSDEMTDEEFDSMSDDELVDRLIAETDYSDEEDDYLIVDIEIING